MSGIRDITISKIFKKVITLPIMPAAILGLLLFFFEIRIPEVLATPLNLITDMNTPLAMLIAGISIYGTNVAKVLKDKRIYAICFLRLIAMPLLTILFLSFFEMPHLVRAVIVTASACPSAAIVIVLAQNYDRDTLFTSEVFAVSTVLSMATIPLVLLLV